MQYFFVKMFNNMNPLSGVVIWSSKFDSPIFKMAGNMAVGYGQVSFINVRRKDIPKQLKN